MCKLESLFKEKFNDIKRNIFFNPCWVEEGGNFHRLIVDRSRRLILDAGEVVKMTDKHQRQYIMVGTPFGMIAVQRAVLFGKTVLRYETTKSLVANYQNFVKEEMNFFPQPAGIILENGLSYLLSEQLHADFRAIAEDCVNAGRAVSDGILPPAVKKKPVDEETKSTAPNGKLPETNKKIWANAVKKFKHKERKQQRAPVQLDESLQVKPSRASNRSLPFIEEPAFDPSQAHEPYVYVQQRVPQSA